MLRRILLALLALGTGSAAAADLGPGAKAPDFSLVGMDGRTYRLADFVGNRGVVLAWFPKAFTSG
jgi:peroxiredoxin Q/BCP